MDFKKFTLVAALLAAPAALFATDYFVTPDGRGTGDGSSWDNAMSFEAFSEKITADDTESNVYYFAGGKYMFTEPLNIIKKGCTLIGGFATNLTGTSHETPTYPSAMPTVFTGDVNGDGVASKGDAECLLSFQTDGEVGKDDLKVTLQGLDFTCAYSETNGDGKALRGALHMNNCGSAEVRDCRFYGNVAKNGPSNQAGGMAFCGHRSYVVFEDCEFTDNWATSRGAAIKLSSEEAGKGYTVLNRCLIARNEIAGSTGSAILVQHGMALYIINSTITDNKAGEISGAIYSNGYSESDYSRNLYIVNSTIAGNEDGPQVEMAANANIYVANSIVVSDGTTDAFSFKGATHEALSGGMNILGSDVNGVFALQDATDDAQAGNNYAKIFGENVLGDNGVIEPLAETGKYTAAALAEAIADWGIGVDVTVDQTGKTRAEGSTPGAYAKTTPSGIQGVEAVEEAGDGAYYTLQGVKLGAHPTATGIYIHNGKKIIIR